MWSGHPELQIAAVNPPLGNARIFSVPASCRWYLYSVHFACTLSRFLLLEQLRRESETNYFPAFEATGYHSHGTSLLMYSRRIQPDYQCCRWLRNQYRSLRRFYSQESHSNPLKAYESMHRNKFTLTFSQRKYLNVVLNINIPIRRVGCYVVTTFREAE